jgi:hypothetical protein
MKNQKKDKVNKLKDKMDRRRHSGAKQNQSFLQLEQQILGEQKEVPLEVFKE